MQRARTIIAATLLSLLGSAAAPVAAQARQADATTPRGEGAGDFDWEIGRWRTHVRRLAKPLSGEQQWLEYEGTSDVSALLDGRGNVVELRVAGPAGRIEGLSLRLYEPQARQWSLNYASARDGKLTAPVVGGFRDGRGVFHGRDQAGGRAVLVRFVITRPAPDTARFEQAFSADGGRSWETNWIAIDTRIAPE